MFISSMTSIIQNYRDPTRILPSPSTPSTPSPPFPPSPLPPSLPPPSPLFQTPSLTPDRLSSLASHLRSQYVRGGPLTTFADVAGDSAALTQLIAGIEEGVPPGARVSPALLAMAVECLNGREVLRLVVESVMGFNGPIPIPTFDQFVLAHKVLKRVLGKGGWRRVGAGHMGLGKKTIKPFCNFIILPFCLSAFLPSAFCLFVFFFNLPACLFAISPFFLLVFLPFRQMLLGMIKPKP